MAQDIVTSISAAITRQENVNPSFNNPGAIMDPASNWTKLVQYPTPQAGQAALNNLVQSYISQGYDLNSFFAKYSPASTGNDPVTYAANVSQWTGLPADVPLNMLQGGGQGTYTGVPTLPQDASEDMSASLGTSGWGAVALAGAAVLGLFIFLDR